ncbi:hypothetical protein WA026_011624 [Henosepilachna vigintioctopunctata]|uniref:C2H2-type domain-containing protein n=1 Tax=Henosepilachna vigintioctopunctata TaxID=420089 RepID=A0AAW1TSK8_9CUCU
MRQLNKQRVKNGNECLPRNSSKRNFVRKKNKKFRSKTIQKKKLTKKYINRKFICKDRKFGKKGFWLNNIFLDDFRNQDYEYVRCNPPCLDCSKDKTDKLSDSGNIDVGKSHVSDHISNISSESVSTPPKLKTDGIKSNSKISTRTYSSVCKISSEIKLISDNNNKSIHNKTEFVSAATLSKKSSHQQVKLEVHVEKTQQYEPTFLKKEKSSSKNHTACNICSTKFQNIEDLKAHKESDAHDKMTFVCPICSSVFSNTKDLKKHRKKTKHKKIKLMCSVCFSLFPSKFEIELHIRSTKHKTINKFPTGSVLCLTCNSIFSSKNMLDQHVLKSHTSSVNSKSSLNGSTSDTKNALDQQKPKPKQEVGNHLCTICLKGFNSRANLNNHMKNGVHETVKSSIQGMSTKKCLQSPTIHAEQIPENEFINLRQFLRNTNQNITCTLCRRQFPTEENLREHMESDSHNSLSACVNNITSHTPKISIEELSDKQKLDTLLPTHDVAINDNFQEQPINNAWQEIRKIVSLNQSTKVEEHSASVHEVTSNKNSLDHDDITLDDQKSVNVIFASEFNDVKPQMETAVTKRIICTICQKEFAAERDLEQHMNSKVLKHNTTSFSTQEIATDENLIELPISNVGQESRQVFSASEFSVEGQNSGNTNHKKVTCTVCYKQFAAEVSLHQHMEHIHKSHSASVHEVTTDKNSLDHDITLDEQKSVNVIFASEFNDVKPQLETAVTKRINCTICQKEFAAEIDLEQHMNSKVLKHNTTSFSTQEIAADENLIELPISNIGQESRQIFSASEFTDVDQESRSNKSKKTTCPVCYTQFSAEVSLKQHMENTHKSLSTLVHEVTSNESLEQAITLDRQKSENPSSVSNVGQEVGSSKQRKITCTLCQKQFSDETNLKQHMESSVHKTVPSFGFPIDNNSQKQHTNHNTQKQENISSISHVGQEVGSSKQRIITCTLCPKQFSDEASLKQHMGSSAHKTVPSSTFGFPIEELGSSKQRKITCTLCPKQFSDEASLKQHMESSVHKTVPSSTFGFPIEELGSSKQRKITCTLCPKQFSDEASLKQHMRSSAHKTDPSCAFGFPIGKNPQKQNTNPNNQDQENISSFCEVQSKPTNILNQDSGSIGHKKNKCTICQKEFAAPKDLQQHLDSSIHETKSIRCNECGSIFLTLKSLEDHLNSPRHQSIECSTCMRIFASKDALDQHLKNSKAHKEMIALNSIPKNNESNSKSSISHVSQEVGSSNQRKITCTLCQKQFSDEASLKQHMGSGVHKTVPSFGFPIDNNSQKQHTNHNTQKQENMSSISHVGQEVGSSNQRKITCTLCQKQFSDEASLKQHMGSSVHKTVPSFGFPIDNNSQKQHTNHNTQKQENMSSISHVGQEVGSSNQRKITCALCQKQFSDEASLKQHMGSSVHKTVPSFGFPIDNNSQKQHTNHNTQKQENMSSISHVGQEVGSSNQKKITCTLCQKQFSDEASLKQHMGSSVHKTVPSFGFPIDNNSQKQHTNHNTQDQENISSFCEVQSNPTNILNQDSGSSGHKKNKCTICQKEFAAPKDLQQHLDSSIHTTKSIRCNECGSLFLTLKSLEDHLNSPRHQSIECSTCMRIFASKDALDQHLKNSKAHKEMITLNSIPKNNESNTKSFSSETDVTCYVCGAVFTQNSALKQHINATGHTDLNNICEVCNHSFKSKNILDQHMRDEHNHVYTCSTCLKEFGTEQDVVQHIQAVHGNNSYFCPICDKMFYYEFSLNDHMKKTGHAYSKSVCTICFATFSSKNALKQHLNNTSHKSLH